MRVRHIAAAVALLAVTAPLAAGAPPARALTLPALTILTPPPPPPPVIAPVAARLTRDPDDGVVRGTVILVHGGGWAGHDATAEQTLFSAPGDVFHARGWRVVSIDYDEGAAGIDGVLSAVGEELDRGTSRGPLCVYGESAGAHLALVAASRTPAIDCVIALGAPTDLALYEADGPSSANDQVRLVASRMATYFGTTAQQLAPWNPVTLAPAMRADVLLIDEGDDPYVPLTHAERFQAARPTTELVVLEPGDPADPSTAFVHGTVSAPGRAMYASAIGAFADRAVAAGVTQRRAARTGCAGVNRTLEAIRLAAVQSALACLARATTTSHQRFDRGWRRTSVSVRGEISASQIWARLRAKAAGRTVLAALARHRAALSVVLGEQSRVTLRLRR